MADTTQAIDFKTLEDELRKAQIEKQIKEANDWTYAREESLTKAKGEGSDFTDIFKQQESFNQSIVKVIEGMGGSGQPTYVTAQAPQQAAESSRSPNYTMYAIIGIAIYFLFLRKKR